MEVLYTILKGIGVVVGIVIGVLMLMTLLLEKPNRNNDWEGSDHV